MAVRRLLGALLTLSSLLLVAQARAQAIDPGLSALLAPQATAAIAHQFLTAYPTVGGGFNLAQPQFTDIGGTLASSQCPNATTISTGCLIVGGGLSVTGAIVQMGVLSPIAHNFVSSISSGGIPQLTQPNINDVAATTALVTAKIDNGSGSAGNILTVSAVTFGSIAVGNTVSGLGVLGATTITSTTGGLGGTGTYTIGGVPQLVPIETMNINVVGLIYSNGGGLAVYNGANCGTQFISALDYTGTPTCSGGNIVFGTTPVSGALLGVNGGTGVANTGKTITLGASLATTGAGAPTLAFPASPFTYTFQASSDTLVGRATVDTLTNKSISASEINSGSFITAQSINLNSAALPNLSSTPAILKLMNVDGVGSIVDLAAAGASSAFRFNRADGTVASPTALVTNDEIGTLSYAGYDGVIWANTASVKLLGIATQNWSASGHGAELQIQTTANGAVAPQTEGIIQSGLAMAGGVPKGLGTVNAPGGFWQGNTSFSFGGTFATGGPVTMTGSGPTTLVFPSTAATYTFPGVGSVSLVTTSVTNVFTHPQIINTNASAFPAIPTPQGLLNLLASDGTQSSAALLTAAGAGGSFIRLGRVDGTVATPTGLVPGDVIGSYNFIGWDTTAWSGASARAVATATETWSAAAHGTQYQIQATQSGSSVLQTEATFQGGLALGSGTPQGLGSANAPNGFYIGPSLVVSAARGGTFSSLSVNASGSVFPGSIATTVNILAADGGPTRETLLSSGSGQVSAARFYHVNGTVASPSAVAAGDVLGNLVYGGWDSAVFNSALSMMATATENWGTLAHGSMMQVTSTLNGTTGQTIEATFHGGVAFGSGSPQGPGTANAPLGFYVGSTQVVSAVGAGNFPGGVNAALGTGTPVASVCLDASNNIIKKTTAGSCI